MCVEQNRTAPKIIKLFVEHSQTQKSKIPESDHKSEVIIFLERFHAERWA